MTSWDLWEKINTCKFLPYDIQSHSYMNLSLSHSYTSKVVWEGTAGHHKRPEADSQVTKTPAQNQQ